MKNEGLFRPGREGLLLRFREDCGSPTKAGKPSQGRLASLFKELSLLANTYHGFNLLPR